MGETLSHYVQRMLNINYELHTRRLYTVFGLEGQCRFLKYNLITTVNINVVVTRYCVTIPVTNHVTDVAEQFRFYMNTTG